VKAKDHLLASARKTQGVREGMSVAKEAVEEHYAERMHEQLAMFAEARSVSLTKDPQKIKTGAYTFLIWGDDPCVFYNERDGEVGQGCRAWVEHYAKTATKLAGQHDAAEFERDKKRAEFIATYEFEHGRPAIPREIEEAANG
jgi:hypothetical protein